LKAAKEKQIATYKGALITLSAYFLAGTLQTRKMWYDVLKISKRGNSKMAARGRKQKANLL
jgi:hypothetical protein